MFVKGFSSSVEMFMSFFLFILLIRLVEFLDVKPILHYWDKFFSGMENNSFYIPLHPIC